VEALNTVSRTEEDVLQYAGLGKEPSGRLYRFIPTDNPSLIFRGHLLDYQVDIATGNVQLVVGNKSLETMTRKKIGPRTHNVVTQHPIEALVFRKGKGWAIKLASLTSSFVEEDDDKRYVPGILELL
jgi:hypothetical protein